MGLLDDDHLKEIQNIAKSKSKSGVVFTGGTAYPLKTNDFFPYADIQNGYWTGTTNNANKIFKKNCAYAINQSNLSSMCKLKTYI